MCIRDSVWADGVRDPATRLLKDAIADEKLFRELLSAKTINGSLPDKSIKRLNAWASVVAAEHGGALVPDATEAPPEQVELPAGRELSIDTSRAGSQGTSRQETIDISRSIAKPEQGEKFARQLGHLVIKEGGYKFHNDPDDPGGPTFAGISRNNNPDWVGWQVFDQGGDPTPYVADRYYTHYWRPIEGDLLDEHKAEIMFSTAVLSGPQTAIRLAQDVVGVEPDGFMGPITLQALSSVPPEYFASEFTRRRKERYRGLDLKPRVKKKYRRGWNNRANADAVPRAADASSTSAASVEPFRAR